MPNASRPPYCGDGVTFVGEDRRAWEREYQDGRCGWCEEFTDRLDINLQRCPDCAKLMRGGS